MVYFYPPGGYIYDTYGYSCLELSINPGSCTRFYPTVMVRAEWNVGQSVVDPQKLGYNFAQREWTRISIPLA